MSSSSHSLSPQSPQRRFASLVSQTARQWRRVIDRKLQPYGLTEATWVPLLYLARMEKPILQKDLAEAIYLDASSVVRLLDNLQRLGFIERREGLDRRAKEIHLTPRGLERVIQVEGTALQVRNQVLSGVKDEELEVMSGMLEQVLASLALVDKEPS
ncbi:MarR family transcriptional regulator [Sodalis ligni]|jgi:MarR family transcriptional regulator for hemolysin|uniref:MarR family transcriptional regulator for hemolysin n=1 Tax=Sodalis ligni TaxID=2697027 RepID=A0A4R1N7G1_9GAMM|nr:MarR family transcriptional regulator [Sodalis ligni]QWA13239.1 MarR family transcriptional regulator [Sodalis ligni]TCL03113.1 MarR family transcriptional regulator for hemolysin [Sodalis ligni]